MKISDKINSNTIVLPLKSDCIHDVLQELLDHCIKLDYLTSSVKLISSLDEKEKIISSASGRCVAYHYNTSIEVDLLVQATTMETGKKKQVTEGTIKYVKINNSGAPTSIISFN